MNKDIVLMKEILVQNKQMNILMFSSKSLVVGAVI